MIRALLGLLGLSAGCEADPTTDAPRWTESGSASACTDAVGGDFSFGGFTFPYTSAVDGGTSWFVVDEWSRAVVEVSREGEVLDTWSFRDSIVPGLGVAVSRVLGQVYLTASPIGATDGGEIEVFRVTSERGIESIGSLDQSPGQRFGPSAIVGEFRGAPAVVYVAYDAGGLLRGPGPLFVSTFPLDSAPRDVVATGARGDMVLRVSHADGYLAMTSLLGEAVAIEEASGEVRSASEWAAVAPRGDGKGWLLAGGDSVSEGGAAVEAAATDWEMNVIDDVPIWTCSDGFDSCPRPFSLQELAATAAGRTALFWGEMTERDSVAFDRLRLVVLAGDATPTSCLLSLTAPMSFPLAVASDGTTVSALWLVLPTEADSVGASPTATLSGWTGSIPNE